MKRVRRFWPLLFGILLVVAVIYITSANDAPVLTAHAANSLDPAAPEALPDLTLQLSVSPMQITIEQSVVITRTVRNEGFAFARDFCSYIYVDPATRPPLSDAPGAYENCLHARLDPGFSNVYAKGYTFSTCGRHVIYAWVDPLTEVSV